MPGQQVYCLILLKPIQNLKYGPWPVTVFECSPRDFQYSLCMLYHTAFQCSITYLQIALCSLHYTVLQYCIVMAFEQRGCTSLYFFFKKKGSHFLHFSDMVRQY